MSDALLIVPGILIGIGIIVFLLFRRDPGGCSKILFVLFSAVLWWICWTKVAAPESFEQRIAGLVGCLFVGICWLWLAVVPRAGLDLYGREINGWRIRRATAEMHLSKGLPRGTLIFATRIHLTGIRRNAELLNSLHSYYDYERKLLRGDKPRFYLVKLREGEKRQFYETAAYFLEPSHHIRDLRSWKQRSSPIWRQQFRFVFFPDTQTTYDQANKSYMQGDHKQAERLYLNALHTGEMEFRPEHPQIANLLINLANIYHRQGKYAEEERLRQRALRIQERCFGSDHTLVTYPHTGQADLYCKQGRYADAEPLYKEALNKWEGEFGPEHPQVAYALSGLANLYHMQGKYADAEPLYQRALKIREKAEWGPEHPYVPHQPLNGLAKLYREQGRYADAEPLYLKALHTEEQRLGQEHPQIFSALTNLADLYREQGKYEEAEPLYQHALNLVKQGWRFEQSSQVAIVLNGLANLYRDQGKYEEAEPLYRDVLRQQEVFQGTEKAYQGPMTAVAAETMHDFAQFWEVQGNNEEASGWYMHALHARELVLGMQHSHTVKTRKSLIAQLHALGKHELAARVEANQSKL